MKKELKYPVGSTISWCGEEYVVVENYGDHNGRVRYADGDDEIFSFYFNYQGEKAVVISK